LLRVVGHGVEDQHEPVQHPPRLGGVGDVRAVVQVDADDRSGPHQQGERVVRRVAAGHPAHLQPGGGLGGGQCVGVDGVVLERGEGVEQVGVAGEGGDLAEPEVLRVEHGDQGVLHRTQVRGQ
jgi:hypothetical protein